MNKKGLLLLYIGFLSQTIFGAESAMEQDGPPPLVYVGPSPALIAQGDEQEGPPPLVPIGEENDDEPAAQVPKEKRHKCDELGCSYATDNSGDFKKHKRTHTGEKPYVCSHQGCDYKTGDNSNFEKHIRTHKGEKPHVCLECGRGFARKDALKRHMRSHYNSQPLMSAPTPRTMDAAHLLLGLGQEEDVSEEESMEEGSDE